VSQTLIDSIPALWLRDACACEQCRHPSGQRLRGVTALDPDTAVAAVLVDGDDVRVTFDPDGHRSRFSLGWLAENAPGHGRVFDDRSEHSRSLWRAADLPAGPPRVAWADLSDPGAARVGALSLLFDTGALLVTGVPIEPGTVLAVARSIGHVRTTNYGDLFDVRSEPRPTNLAYTSHAIAPHTDNPYREPVPGVQLLHCLVASTDGGENVLIDGFSAASILRAEDPDAFGVLASTRLTFRYEDAATALRASAPVVETNPDGAVRAIRWNERSVEPPQVAPEQVPEVYRAMRAFAGVLGRDELQVRFTLRPGDCIVFDNTRILHARTSFVDTGGARHLQGCYADLDALVSAIAVSRR
jgi:gamma-butyrobetaine dioxygenase